MRFTRQKRMRGLVIAVAAVVFAYALSQTGSMVLAARSGKIAHVFPQTTKSIGWNGAERALSQDLSAKAMIDSFSAENAAYIRVDAVADTVPDASSLPEVADQVSADVEPDAASDELSSESGESVDSDAPAAAIDEESSESTPSGEDVSAGEGGETEVSGADVPTEAPSEEPPVTPAAETVPAPEAIPAGTDAAPAPVPDAAPLPETSSWLKPFVHVVHAQESATSSESTPAVLIPELTGVSDVASCTITGNECYTLQVAGFAVEGSVTEKPFSQATLHFSFAHRALRDGDEKLAVRYLHDGRWRDAGEDRKSVV